MRLNFSFLDKLKQFVADRFLEKRTTRKRRVSTYFMHVEGLDGSQNSCYVWDLSVGGAGLLAPKSCTFSSGDKVTVKFPLKTGEPAVTRTARVTTVKIYHPKPSRDPLPMLRCSLVFDAPLTTNEFDSVAVESFATE